MNERSHAPDRGGGETSKRDDRRAKPAPSRVATLVDRVGWLGVRRIAADAKRARAAPQYRGDEHAAVHARTHAGDVDSVEVHRDPEAAAIAELLGARAYTFGDHVGFAADAPSLDTVEGRELLEHELAHVAQQRDRAPSFAFEDDPNQQPTELQAKWFALIDKKKRQLEELETGTGKYVNLDLAQMPALRARISRELAIIENNEPQSQAELDSLEQMANELGQTEEQTLKVLPEGSLDNALTNQWGFPDTWANRVAATMKNPWDLAEVGRARDDAWKLVLERADMLPPYLARYGLPVDFGRAMELHGYTVFRSFDGLSTNDGPLAQFIAAMMAYDQSEVIVKVAERYGASLAALASTVRSGESIVNRGAWSVYQGARADQPPRPDNVLAPEPEVLPGYSGIDPFKYEQDTIRLLMAIGIADQVIADLKAKGEFATRLTAADALIAGIPFYERVGLARVWNEERGYNSYVNSVLWNQLKEHSGDLLKKAGKEVAKFAGAQMIPIFNVLYDLYQVGKAAFGAASALYELAAAEIACSTATTVVDLQRAAAHLALAEKTKVLELVTELLAVYGNWAALTAVLEKSAGKTLAAATDEAGNAATKTATRVAEDAATAVKTDAAAQAEAARRAAEAARAATRSRLEADAARRELDDAFAELLGLASRVGVYPLGKATLATIANAAYHAVKAGVKTFKAFLKEASLRQILSNAQISKLSPKVLAELEAAYWEGATDFVLASRKILRADVAVRADVEAALRKGLDPADLATAVRMAASDHAATKAMIGRFKQLGDLKALKTPVAGVDQVVADLARGGNWARGAEWMFKYLDRIGAWKRDGRALAFEIVEGTSLGDREVDAIIDGVRHQFKTWMKFDRAKFIEQFMKDLELTDNLSQPLKWVFDGSRGMNAATIEAEARRALESIRSKFDAATFKSIMDKLSGVIVVA